jgi:hypothetical protein
MLVDLCEHIAHGLQRRAVTKCSKWAEHYRVVKGKPWTFDRFPWSKEMHDANSPVIVGQKAAQVGYTETAMNRTFYKLDIEKVDCLYVLPSESDASDFSSGRFDPALEDSMHLKELFSDVNNVGLKRAGVSTLYVRGSKSRSKLKSIPTGFIVLDEVDEMMQDNIPLALERASGQVIKQCLMISTPTVTGHGINKFYNLTTMEQFFFPCPHCSKHIQLTFPECLEITAEQVTDLRIKESTLICPECRQTLEHETKSEWLSEGSFVAEYPGRENRGFNINQLYSSTIEPWELATGYIKSLSDPTDEQEFFNSKLGKTHVVGDARVTDDHIIECYSDYMKCDTPRSQIISMGVDVGAFWHYEVIEWFIKPDAGWTDDPNESFTCRLLQEDKIPLREGVSEIINVIYNFGVRSCVIDRHPETYAGFQIASQFPGLVYLCMFGRGINGRRLSFGSDNEHTITVDRTSWFDCALGRIINGQIALPRNLSLEYRRQIKEPARVYERDTNGNPIGRWVSVKRDDHFALTRVYSEIGLVIAVENVQPKTIEKVF